MSKFDIEGLNIKFERVNYVKKFKNLFWGLKIYYFRIKILGIILILK